MTTLPNQQLADKARQLKGITYLEWTKLRMIIDAVFDRQKSELELQLQLTDDDDIERAIRSRLG